MDMWFDRMESPIGSMLLVWGNLGLRALDFADHQDRFERLLRLRFGNNPAAPAYVPRELRDPIEAYFAGELTAIESIPVEINGTDFQRSVWLALRDIPAGQTLSYGELAARIGRPGASRAVGLANGSNPIGIVLPCHRVIGANGSLTGYGGGIHRKSWLLAHEGARLCFD